MRVGLSDLPERQGVTTIRVARDQIATLSEGAIEKLGAAMMLYETSLTPFLAGFIGSSKMKLCRGRAIMSLRIENGAEHRYANGGWGTGSGQSGSFMVSLAGSEIEVPSGLAQLWFSNTSPLDWLNVARGGSLCLVRV